MAASLEKLKTPTNFGARQGFTLTEIVITISLIGILAAVAIPNFIDMGTDAKTAITKDEMAMIKRGIVGDGRAVAGGTYAFPGYEADMGAPPGSLHSLSTNPNTGNTTQDYDPVTRRGWRGPYVDTNAITAYAKDGWDQAYVFSTSPRVIRSKGPNLTDNSGTGDDIQLTY